MTPRRSWEIPSEELAGMLGVDAVVRTEVQKTRYLSNWSSFGLEVGAEILHDILHETDDYDGYDDDHAAGAFAKTHDIYVDAVLVDGRSGEILWGIVVERGINWTRGANSVVRGVSRKVAREFPYRG